MIGKYKLFRKNRVNKFRKKSVYETIVALCSGLETKKLRKDKGNWCLSRLKGIAGRSEQAPVYRGSGRGWGGKEPEAAIRFAITFKLKQDRIARLLSSPRVDLKLVFGIFYSCPIFAIYIHCALFYIYTTPKDAEYLTDKIQIVYQKNISI